VPSGENAKFFGNVKKIIPKGPLFNPKKPLFLSFADP